MNHSIVLVLSLFALCRPAFGENLPDLQPILGQRGKLIASADFERPPVEGTLKGFGDYTVKDGFLRQQQKEGQDHHPVLGFTQMLGLDVAADRAFELKGCILQFDFRTDQADLVQVEFPRRAGGIFPGQPVPEKGGISYPAGSFPPIGKGAMLFPPAFSVVFELLGSKKRRVLGTDTFPTYFSHRGDRHSPTHVRQQICEGVRHGSLQKMSSFH